ncbi:hypothetical protein PPTG_20249 [Phytophthora nicotianae INRA-310]|uniref:Uncharacterized protein n=1 Tax=Phytophthora nicotianae (strain INRA-310) TaxID=761204 RepID=W2PAY0_PHYN3|nr:hypothetical protein PPTG_20249 [Phytophthora nicotianae INRA-310]ETM97378.1 hypothetical protein PPTG_20249 [Phytophthora nicotianae INRA-310]
MLMRDYNNRVDDCLFINFFREVSDDLDKVKSLMVKLKSLNQSSNLSSIEAPAKSGHSLELHDDDDLVADDLPDPAANRRLRKLLEDLSKVDSVSKELQASTVSLLDARVYFDGRLDSLPALVSHIAAIVHSLHCEAACVKVLDGKTAKLTRAETASLRRFAVQREETSVAAAVDDADNSFVEQVKKRRKLATTTVGTQRQGLNPITLKLLFLRVNSSYWNAQVVNECT